MSFQSRRIKVFAAALIAIIAVAAVLKALGNNPPPAGAFSLSEYYHLAPIEKVISSNITRISRNWNRVEISDCYTTPIDIDKPSSRNGLVYHDVLDYHFIIWNGLIGGDGQIQSTEKWQRQLLTIPGQTWYGSERTIRIGVIADGKIASLSDFQIKKTEELAESLSRKFNIRPECIDYPENW